MKDKEIEINLPKISKKDVYFLLLLLAAFVLLILLTDTINKYNILVDSCTDCLTRTYII